MLPLLDIRGLTPLPGRLKCLWVRGADGQLESVWVPDWELADEPPAPEILEPIHQAG